MNNLPNNQHHYPCQGKHRSTLNSEDGKKDWNSDVDKAQQFIKIQWNEQHNMEKHAKGNIKK